MNNTIERLKTYNAWRRGADMTQPDPQQLGEDIDTLIAEVEQSATDQAIAYKRGRVDGMVDAVTRCAEIATMTHDCAKDKKFKRGALAVAEAIRKEFL